MTGGHVVVGVSGSLGSLAALRAAVDEARNSGRALAAVTAWEPPEGEILYARNPDSAWAAYHEDLARETLDRAVEEALGGLPEDVAVRKLVVRGKAGRVLCALADRPQDLLVIGARPGVRRAPVRRYVQQHAHSAVLTAPAPCLPRHTVRALRHARAEDFALHG
ncbi:universal stress protein [Streptomyces sp. WM6378]|uniref:universal stress protein n=1 Tax=Streptomyces sp. WM6378 TaxID=1415557 RepID=UPI0006B042F3|nr:universal stress protein [Streptomyces sp. WM6378]